MSLLSGLQALGMLSLQHAQLGALGGGLQVGWGGVG